MTAKKTTKKSEKTPKKEKVEKTKPEPEKKEPDNKHILIHKYNPKFELLNEEEIKKVLEEHGIKLIELPKILITDPICKLFNAKVNDVFKITRKSYTAGESVYYRVVING